MTGTLTNNSEAANFLKNIATHEHMTQITKGEQLDKTIAKKQKGCYNRHVHGPNKSNGCPLHERTDHK